MTDFEEYIRQGEPSQKERAQNWRMAIGLQQVDGLTVSPYLLELARQNIEGKISIDTVQKRIDSYYRQQASRTEEDEHTDEADKVSSRITDILNEKTFSFSPLEYLNIHRRLFMGIYKFAGKVRDYNISKAEWVLNGDTVLYAGANTLMQTLEYDFEQEKAFRYKGLSMQQTIEHLTHFVADLWQIHIFGEGNTRTTAVFLIKYLRKLGFKKVKNDMFAEHSWYFRNALVRANYENLAKGVYHDESYLIRFLSNVLLGEAHPLKNRFLHVHWKAETDVQSAKNEEKVPKNFLVTLEKLPVIGKKFLVNGQKFPVVGLEILKRIYGNPSITILELAAQLDLSDRAVKNNLNKLRDAGLVFRIGSDKTGHWQVGSDNIGNSTPYSVKNKVSL
jgi:fido (protein-threonine AMPylation protein)/DNA-binding transcriptional ArsR family regulator